MPVSPDDLQKLKNPFGELIADRDLDERRIGATIKGAKFVVTVGDATTERLVSFKIIPDIAIIDGKERRLATNHRASYPARELHCANPSGSITTEALDILRQAVTGTHPVRIVVEGEEDMLALPMFWMAPEGSVVLYGQPLEGIVAVNISASKKNEAKDLMDRIGIN
jgi:GTP-dependent dephospho-CoA kinase